MSSCASGIGLMEKVFVDADPEEKTEDTKNSEDFLLLLIVSL